MAPPILFVTGASGFIGRRVVQLLSHHGYKIRVLVRRVPSEAFDSSVELVVGDLTRPETYGSYLNGAWGIVHAGLTDDFSADVQATSMLHQLGSEAGVRRFVHLSSIVIYGDPPNGIVIEDTLPLPTSDTYSRTKLAIEEALRTRSGIPELVILRLGCVYGPGGGWWTGGLLNLMERGRVIAVNGGNGTANLVHVEDVAAIVLLAVTHSNPLSGAFNVTDGMPVPWRRYFSELESILGRAATVSMSAGEAREHGRKWLHPSAARRALRKLFGTKLVYPLDERGIQGYASQAIYSIQKARTELLFEPAYDLSHGMQTVAQHYRRGKQRLAGGAVKA